MKKAFKFIATFWLLVLNCYLAAFAISNFLASFYNLRMLGPKHFQDPTIINLHRNYVIYQTIWLNRQESSQFNKSNNFDFKVWKKSVDNREEAKGENKRVKRKSLGSELERKRFHRQIQSLKKFEAHNGSSNLPSEEKDNSRLSLKYPYLGCYLDDYPRRDMVKRIFSPNLTNAICALNCGKQGFPFSATQWGTECFCGMSYGKFGTPEKPFTRTIYPVLITNKVSLSGALITPGTSACRMPCPGNWSEVCGGNNVNSVYYTSLPVRYRYLGCYRDKSLPQHDFPRTNILERPFTMSASMCYHHCLAQNIPYFAIKSGSFCYCGYKYGDYGLVIAIPGQGNGTISITKVLSERCDVTCPGNSSEICGGRTDITNSIYATDLSLDHSAIYLENVGSTWAMLRLKLGLDLNQSFTSQPIVPQTRYAYNGLRNNRSQGLYANVTQILTFKVHYLKASSIIKSRHIKSKDLTRAEYQIFTRSLGSLVKPYIAFNLTSLFPKSTYKLLITMTGNVFTKVKQKFIGNSMSITTCSDIVFITSVTAKNISDITHDDPSNQLNLSWTVLNNYTVRRESYFIVRYRFLGHALCHQANHSGDDDLLLEDVTEMNDDLRMRGKFSTSATHTRLNELNPASVYGIRIATRDDICGVYFRATTNSSIPFHPISNFHLLPHTLKYSSAEFAWHIPSCQVINGPLIKFQVQATSNATSESIAHYYECKSCSSLKINDLQPKTSYDIRIRYFNEVGPSPYSISLLIITPHKPRYAFYVTLLILLSFLVMIALLFLRCLRRNQYIARKLGLGSTEFVKNRYKSSPFFRNKRDYTNGSSYTTKSLNNRKENIYTRGCSTRSPIQADTLYKNVQKLFCDIPWQAIQVSETILGEGQFSQVRKATVLIKDQWIPVALKIMDQDMIKKDAFLSELEIMGKVGFHDNIVNLIGACIHDGVYFVALEYLEMGDLRTFLRKNRFLDKDDGCLKLYSVSETQLVNFALDVAKGMAHLAANNVIHRDLAARNILVSSGPSLVCKVGDFGLSREQNIYVQSTASHLPWRWMSIESLSHRIYTTKSDVWSFGILLWEIVTLGGTPYWPLDIHDYKGLLKTLYTGYRMPQPRSCNTEAYELMICCWESNPGARPTFADIVKRLGRIKSGLEGSASISRTNQTGTRFKMTNWASGTYLNDSGVSSDQSLIGHLSKDTTHLKGSRIRQMNRNYHAYEHMKFNSKTLDLTNPYNNDKVSVSSDETDASIERQSNYVKSKGKKASNKRKTWDPRMSKTVSERYHNDRKEACRPTILRQESDFCADKFLRLRKKLAACESIELADKQRSACSLNVMSPSNDRSNYKTAVNEHLTHGPFIEKSPSFYDSLEYAEVQEAETIFDSLNRVIRETDIKKDHTLIL